MPSTHLDTGRNPRPPLQKKDRTFQFFAYLCSSSRTVSLFSMVLNPRAPHGPAFFFSAAHPLTSQYAGIRNCACAHYADCSRRTRTPRRSRIAPSSGHCRTVPARPFPAAPAARIYLPAASFPSLPIHGCRSVPPCSSTILRSSASSSFLKTICSWLPVPS